MGEKALVESQISDGIELVKKLDERNAGLSFAAWYYYDDVEDWRLLLAGSELDRLLKQNESIAYHLIFEEMTKLPLASISIADIKIVASDSALPATVAVMIQTPPNALVRTHFTDNFVNGIYLKEMFVIRSSRPVLVTT
ncbi:MAG: hypothetical protein QM785_18565 [Pyrinomonadaceae bacterium]